MPSRPEMLGGVPVLRIVAASDVPAGSTQPKMHPGVAEGEALLVTYAADDGRLWRPASGARRSKAESRPTISRTRSSRTGSSIALL